MGTKQFDTGAVRSDDADETRFDLISPIGQRRLAETYAEGARKYGDHNWLKGMPASELMNHAERHLNLWKSGDESEDHLAHAAWNLFSLMHFEETRPELIDVPARKAEQEPSAKITTYNKIAYDALVAIDEDNLNRLLQMSVRLDGPTDPKTRALATLWEARRQIEVGLVPATPFDREER